MPEIKAVKKAVSKKQVESLTIRMDKKIDRLHETTDRRFDDIQKSIERVIDRMNDKIGMKEWERTNREIDKLAVSINELKGMLEKTHSKVDEVHSFFKENRVAVSRIEKLLGEL